MCFRGATQVYSVTAHGNYGGGYAVVAAENELAASRLAGSIPPGSWDVTWVHGRIDKLEGVLFNGSERVLDHYEYGE